MHHLDRRKVIEEYIDKFVFQFKEGLMEAFRLQLRQDI
jgi:hypothetical protein